MDGKDCFVLFVVLFLVHFFFFLFPCIITSELDETEDAALEIWVFDFFFFLC